MNTVMNYTQIVGSCNTLNDLSKKVCAPNETKDLNKHVFNMITGVNNSCKYKCKFGRRKCNSDQKQNNDKCQCKYKNKKNIVSAKKIIFRILLHIVVKMIDI